ncbi:DUF4359 domain-containing protein [Vacuolonema iberomarrocanum]|uniref:DUF4359 domain-containing protein n=1 Tax=Vacuolonema iberomarrocanum TaxID=3454632 RepID=UPI001A094E3B|nr:DUF4359 domain-containing protein [filamentous cyanobacterium LEGE 07170]
MMKVLKFGTLGVAIVLGGVAIAMAVTNPKQERYNAYATEQLITYLKGTFCDDLPGLLGSELEDRCLELVDESEPRIAEIIAENTEHRDLVVLSLYTTELQPAELLPEDVRAFFPTNLLPTYEVETVGVFQRFWVYETTQR